MYAATVDDRRLTFEVECVWRRNMIMRDRETGTLWQQATGEALVGPLAGKQLDLLAGELTTWGGWKTAHPATLAALEPSEWQGMLPRDKMMPMLEKITTFVAGFAPGKSRTDRRLPPRETVVGILVEGTSRAYRLIDLQQVGIIEELFNGQRIKVEFDEPTAVVRVYANGTPLHGQRTWWLGWYEFHPQTTIFELKNNQG